MKWLMLALWVCAGLGVVSVEGKARPELLEDGNLMLLSIAVWPAFPIGRFYGQNVPQHNRGYSAEGVKE